MLSADYTGSAGSAYQRSEVALLTLFAQILISVICG
jgi:hypothetical protein